MREKIRQSRIMCENKKGRKEEAPVGRKGTDWF
jgi:hypothetical protein